MATISAFTFISMDGYYKDLNDSIDWHSHEGEESAFSAESLQTGNILLFGRKTYEMMRSFWSTSMAAEAFPEVAAGMNKARKLVLSTTLTDSDWNNTQILGSDPLSELKDLKNSTNTNITLLGSGSVLAQLASAELLDNCQIMIDPVALGGGTPIFQGLTAPQRFRLSDHRIFRSGTVLLTYVR